MIKGLDIDKQILQCIILRSMFSHLTGLYYGKMGVLIFLYIFRKKRLCIDMDLLLDYLIDDVCNNVTHDMNYSFEDGISGIGWGLEFLVQEKFIQADNDFLYELDQIIMEKSLFRISDCSLDRGLEGILHYVFMRLKGAKLYKSSHGFTSEFVNEVCNNCTKSDYVFGKTFVSYFDNGIFNYNPYSILKYVIGTGYNADIQGIDPYFIGLRNGLSGYLLNKYI